MAFRSLIGWGRLEPVTEEAEKRTALEALMSKYSPPRVWKFDPAQVRLTTVLKLTLDVLTAKQNA